MYLLMRFFKKKKKKKGHREWRVFYSIIAVKLIFSQRWINVNVHSALFQRSVPAGWRFLRQLDVLFFPQVKGLMVSTRLKSHKWENVVYIKHAKIYVSQQLCCKTSSIHGRVGAGGEADTPDGWEAAGKPDERGAKDTTVGRGAADTPDGREATDTPASLICFPPWQIQWCQLEWSVANGIAHPIRLFYWLMTNKQMNK